MNTDLTEILRLKLQRKDVPDINRSRDFLRKNDFERVEHPAELEGRVLATYLGTIGYGTLFYNVDSLIPQSEGFLINQSEGRAIFLDFYGLKEFRTGGISRGGIELFLPHYLIDTLGLFAGSNTPEWVEVDELSIGWRYPPKRSISLEEFDKRHQGLSTNIRHILESERIDGLEEFASSLAREATMEGIYIIETKSRIKTPESIASKWINRDGSFAINKVPDINGIRFIVESPNECYRLLVV